LEANVLAEILRHYKLTGDLGHVGLYESKELVRVEENLKEHIRLGHFVAVTGSVGVGKTTLIRKVSLDLKKSKAAMVSESMTIEKERINLTSLVQALFIDFGEKPEKDRESRDRKLFQLIEKSNRRVVLFVDDAHGVPPKTLFGLKALVERGLCVVLAGHPRLGFNLARGQMEEIGMRCERLEIRGLAGEVGPYLEWLIKQAGGEIDIFSPEAQEEMVQLCRTPLQVQRVVWEAIKQGYEEGEKQVSRETIQNVIAPDFRDLRTELKRLGYTVRDIANDYGYQTTQVNRFLDGKLPADDPTSRQLAVFLKSLGVRQSSGCYGVWLR
jgi:type II secretory pathway predicted ATPase ExeA